MGLILFVLLAGLEIWLAVRTCSKEKSTKAYRRNRLMVRGIQAAVVVIALLLPLGQRWRMVPVLIFLAVMTAAAGLLLYLGQKKEEDGIRKPWLTVVFCLLNVLVMTILLIPGFVFTGYKGLPVSGNYQVREASAILSDSSRTDPFEADGSFREVPVHFYWPEGEDADTEKYPLVVFSHGAFGYYQSNTSTYMELASNGYTVAALDHPHHAFFTEDTDGQMVLVDQDFLNTALELSNSGIGEADAAKQLEIYRDWMSLRTADICFVLDELKNAGTSGVLDESWFLTGDDEETILRIIGQTDLSRIGLMGHSMGGASSVAVSRMRDDITAVIDIDGTMLGEYTGTADGRLTVSEEPYEIPILEFVNWDTWSEMEIFLEQYREEGGRYPNDELMRHASAGFSTTIRDTKHMDFTDLPLLSPFLGNMLGSGERDNAETMTIVNSLVLQFFDCYLKGGDAFTVQESY